MSTPVINLLAPRPTTPTPEPNIDRPIWRVKCASCPFYEGGLTTGAHAYAFAEHHRDQKRHAVHIRCLIEVHIDTIRSENEFERG